MPEAA